MKKLLTMCFISTIYIFSYAEETYQEQNNNIKTTNVPQQAAKPEAKQEPKQEPRPDFIDTSDFVKKFNQRFPGYKTLEPKILAELVTIIPAQKTSWGCGLHQSEAAIETAYINAKLRRKAKTRFDEVWSYPLSVDININNPALQNFLSLAPTNDQKKVKDATDAQGYFRVGALPHDLANYININLPNNSKFKARALSKDTLSGSELLNIIRHNLSFKLPTPVFYITSKEQYKMHVYLIIGLKNNSLLILDTSNEGVERIFTKKADDFAKGMNAQPIIELVRQASIWSPLLTLLNLRIADEKTLKLWKPYSVIEFRAE